MDLWSSVRVLLRRWLVIMVGLVLTIGAAAYVYRSAPPSYQDTSRLLLLLPATSNDPGQGPSSPFLYMPTGGLNLLARIIVTVPTSRDFQLEMISQGLVSPYQVGLDPTSPIISVSAEGADVANVRATHNYVVKALQEELLMVQQDEGVPVHQTAHTLVFESESQPQQLSGSATRAVLAVLAAGGLLSLIAAFGVEGASRWRAKRTAARPADVKISETSEPTDPGSREDRSLSCDNLETAQASNSNPEST